MLLQNCKIYIKGDREDIETFNNVICSFAEESKVSDDSKHITSHHIRSNTFKKAIQPIPSWSRDILIFFVAVINTYGLGQQSVADNYIFSSSDIIYLNLVGKKYTSGAHLHALVQALTDGSLGSSPAVNQALVCVLGLTVSLVL